jgi:hypothetical protein
LVRVARWYIFGPEIATFGKFWKAWEWKVLISFMTIWYALWSFVLLYGNLVNFGDHLLHFPHFGILYQEKSGNRGWSLFWEILPVMLLARKKAI